MTETSNPDELSRTEQINLRLSPVQVARLRQAADVVSLERAEQVDPSTLARELLMAGVEEIRRRVACGDPNGDA